MRYDDVWYSCFFFCQNLSLVSDKYFIYKYIYVKEEQLNRLTLCVLYKAEDVDRKTKMKHCKQSCLNKLKKKKKNHETEFDGK